MQNTRKNLEELQGVVRSNILRSSLLLSGRSYEKIYQEINRTTELSDAYLKDLLLYATRHVPYWKKRLNETGVVQGDSVNLDFFPSIPFITKEMIRDNPQEFISKEHKKRKSFTNSTGGSTGDPLRFLQDLAYIKWRHATNAYYYRNILGIDEQRSKKVFIWGSDRDIFTGSVGSQAKIKNWLQNTVLLNSFKMEEKDMERYTKIINSFKPEVIRGYSGALYELAKFIKKKNILIHRPKAIIGAAETITDVMRDVIEDTFNARLYNFYGSREVSAIAGECEKGLLHIFSFFNHVEVVGPHQEEGKIFVTNLHNYSMPFVRYDMGDFGIPGPTSCLCRNPLPTLKKVTGRVVEHLRTKSGGFIPGEYFIHLVGVVCNKGAIRQFQIIQKDYDDIEILTVLGPGFKSEDQKSIEEKIRVVMGNACRIEWKEVENIPKTKNGKYLYTRSHIS